MKPTNHSQDLFVRYADYLIVAAYIAAILAVIAIVASCP